MVDFQTATRDAVKGAICAWLDAAAIAPSWLNEFNRIPVPNVPKFWRTRLCDEDPSDVDPVPPPFTGGQCPTLYDVVMQVDFQRVGGATVTGNFERFVTGPIQGVEIITVSRSDGLNRQVVLIGTDDSSLLAFGRCPPTAQNDCPLDARIVSVSRRDGLPDDCGNPLPDIPPYPDEGDTIPITITYDDRDNNEVTLIGELTIYAPVIAPIFAPVTTIFAPVRVELPDIVFDGTVEIAPNFNFNFGASGPIDGPGDDSDGEDEPENEDDESEGCEQGKPPLLGVFVRSVEISDPRTTTIFQDDAPNLNVPRLANLYFRVKAGKRCGWFGPIDVKLENQFLMPPDGLYAYEAVVEPEPGWQSALIPVLARSGPDS